MQSHWTTEVYYMLIVLITCHSGVTCMSTCHKTNHKVKWCHFVTQYMLQDWFECLWKKEQGISILVCNGKVEEAKKLAQLGLAWKLSRVIRALTSAYFDQEQWLKELNEQCIGSFKLLLSSYWWRSRGSLINMDCQIPIVIARWSFSGKHEWKQLGVIILLQLRYHKKLFLLFSLNENLGKLSVHL